MRGQDQGCPIVPGQTHALDRDCSTTQQSQTKGPTGLRSPASANISEYLQRLESAYLLCPPTVMEAPSPVPTGPPRKNSASTKALITEGLTLQLDRGNRLTPRCFVPA